MKYTVIIFFFINLYVQAQTYKDAFDRLDANINNGNGYSNSNNLSAQLAWGESRIMMSYMAMYRTTGERILL